MLKIVLSDSHVQFVHVYIISVVLLTLSCLIQRLG